MVRALFLISLAASLLFAGALETQIEQMTGSTSYQRNRNLIRILFQNPTPYLTPYGVDIHKVAAKLKANNLLKLRLRHTMPLFLTFATSDDRPLLFMKLVRNVLGDLGYSDLFTLHAVHDGEGFRWSVRIESDALLDPELLAQELQRRGAHLTSIRRDDLTRWRYEIDTARARLITQKIRYNAKNSFRKPLSPYWFDVSGARAVVINSHRGNSWHPYIVFYDRDLRMLDNLSQEKTGYNIKLNVPDRAAYIKIGDIYTLENLRRGISIYISKR